MGLEPLDFPQMWQRPSYAELAVVLQNLELSPPIWNHKRRRSEIIEEQESLASQRKNEVTRYLSSIIKSPLAWIEDDEEKEDLWTQASKRMSERCGRTAMGEVIRRWPFETAAADEFELIIREPALTGDSLGLKTWGSSYVLSQHLPRLAETSLFRLFDETLGQSPPDVLELGSGTGLLGLAAAALWKVPVALSDLPNIVPNLKDNVDKNSSLVESRGGSLTVGPLTWGGSEDEIDQTLFGEPYQFKIVLAADPMYDDDHPALLASAICQNLALGSESRPVFNQYPNQNALEPIISNSRSYGGRTLEKVDSGPLLDSRASVPVKQIKVWDKNSKEDHFDHKLTANTHPYGKGHASNASSEDKFWSEDSRKNKQTNWGKSSLHGQQASSFVINNKTGSTDPSFVKFDGHIETAESADVNHVVENATLPRDRTLIQKIEGLNAKARVSDGKHDLYSEEPDSRHTVSTNVSINQSGANVRLERHYPSGVLVPVSRDKSILDEDKGFGSTVSSGVTTISRHSSPKVQGRGDHGSKGRLNSQEADVWRKRSATSESRGIVPVVSSERTTNIQRKEKLFTEMSSSDGEAKDNSKLSMVDPHVTQHAEMREITKQRAIQLQKEEEERIREQKAKAFAKLEELNRRSANQGKETSSQTLNDVPSHTDPSPTDVVQKPQESKIKFELQFGSFQSGEIGSALASGSDPSKTGQDLHQEDPLLSQKQPLPAVEDTQINDVSGHQNVKVRESSRQKGAGHKQKHDVQSGNNFTDKPIVDGKDKSIISNAVSGSALHHKRRNNRAGKNKHMVDEISSASVHEELDASRPVAESLKRAITQKSHNNDAVVWAPVKAHTKMEVTDENDKKADEDAGPANGSNNPVPSSSKGRRAEIERYVPKAAIKVLAQQGSDQLSTPPIEKSIPDGTSIQGQTKRPVESRHVENKTKQIQTHGSWRQRIPAEPNFVQVSGDSSMTGSTKNSQTSDIAHQSQKPKELLKYSVAKQDEQCGKQQPQEVNEDIAVDGWVIYDEPISSSAIVSGVEGHVKSNRGRNNPFKGHKGSRNQNIDRESHTSAKGDGEYFSEANQTERPRSSKEHRVGQWQPKPQTHVTNHHGNHARGRQTVSDEGDKFFKREVSKDTRMVNMGSRESKDILEDRDNSPNEDSVGDVESAPLGQTDGTNNEQRPSSSGNRWNGSFHGRFNRGREFRGDRSFISQDNRHNYVPSNREKQRQNSRYEYQPVGPQNRNKREINSEGQTENQHAGAKFRDRGQVSHTQRGYGWQRVANQTDAGSE